MGLKGVEIKHFRLLNIKQYATVLYFFTSSIYFCNEMVNNNSGCTVVYGHIHMHVQLKKISHCMTIQVPSSDMCPHV